MPPSPGYMMGLDSTGFADMLSSCVPYRLSTSPPPFPSHLPPPPRTPLAFWLTAGSCTPFSIFGTPSHLVAFPASRASLPSSHKRPPALHLGAGRRLKIDVILFKALLCSRAVWRREKADRWMEANVVVGGCWEHGMDAFKASSAVRNSEVHLWLLVCREMSLRALSQSAGLGDDSFLPCAKGCACVGGVRRLHLLRRDMRAWLRCVL